MRLPFFETPCWLLKVWTPKGWHPLELLKWAEVFPRERIPPKNPNPTFTLSEPNTFTLVQRTIFQWRLFFKFDRIKMLRTAVVPLGPTTSHKAQYALKNISRRFITDSSEMQQYFLRYLDGTSLLVVQAAASL